MTVRRFTDLATAITLDWASASGGTSGGVFNSPVVSSAEHPTRILPFKWISNVDFQVWVSQDGTPGGADPDSTQGSAILYLVTATPT